MILRKLRLVKTNRMNIYIDYDDCLCETARYFTHLVYDMFGKKISYEDITCFDLKQSFGLTNDEYEQMMIKAHLPEELLSYKVTPGAVDAVNNWIEAGHDVSVITGRPFGVYEPSREWLDNNGLEGVSLYCLNKYGREGLFKNSRYSLEIEDYNKMHFDIAIEDSPFAFKFFNHLPDLKVMVFDRPWNRNSELPSSNYMRCVNWKEIKDATKELL